MRSFLTSWLFKLLSFPFTDQICVITASEPLLGPEVILFLSPFLVKSPFPFSTLSQVFCPSAITSQATVLSTLPVRSAVLSACVHSILSPLVLKTTPCQFSNPAFSLSAPPALTVGVVSPLWPPHAAIRHHMPTSRSSTNHSALASSRPIRDEGAWVAPCGSRMVLVHPA